MEIGIWSRGDLGFGVEEIGNGVEFAGDWVVSVADSRELVSGLGAGHQASGRGDSRESFLRLER